ncbi:MAG: C4-dicarboxylate ABC transporter, partial [Elusimicrobia bacterium]|nr:C4-dicarboxylate ABC transporter [Elusimicrobiota bacterium]
GMYTVCTLQFSRALGLDFVAALCRGLFFSALAAWAVVFVGLLRSLASARRS